jgi:hypothetical protein
LDTGFPVISADGLFQGALMRRRWIIFLFIPTICGMHAWADGPLTFEERMKAQEAIERVYYSHRVWPKDNPTPKPSFKQRVSKGIIRKKVEDTIKKSILLDEYWKKPLTGEELQAEMDRIVRQTKDPEILKELFDALNNDPYLIAECLVRPVLADKTLSLTCFEWTSSRHEHEGGHRGSRDFEGILAGTKKVGEWSNEETEHVWYLLKALHFLGEIDLAPKYATLKLNSRPRLDDLKAFLATGKIPPLPAKQEQGLSKARQKIK